MLAHTSPDGNPGSNWILKNANDLADSDVPKVQHLPKSTARNDLVGGLEKGYVCLRFDKLPLLKRYLSIFSELIFDSKVDR